MKIFRKTILLVFILILAGTTAIYGFSDGDKINDKSGGTISLIAPSFVKASEITTSTNLSTEGTSFLFDEAGLSAYAKTSTINLTRAKAAFKTIEVENGEYIIGSVAVNSNENYDVHVYISNDGWMVAYYLKEPPPKILKNLTTFDDNKLEDALQNISNVLGISLPSVNYYDFSHPNANRVQLVCDKSHDTFNFMIPSEIANNTYEFYAVCERESDYSIYIKLSANSLNCGIVNCQYLKLNYKELTFSDDGGLVTPENYYTLSILQEGSSTDPPQGTGGIMLIYRE